jgi:hypothetical protein
MAAATHRGVLGVSWHSRYRNAQHQGCDGPNNYSCAEAFHGLLTLGSIGSCGQFSLPELDARGTSTFKATGIKTQ